MFSCLLRLLRLADAPPNARGTFFSETRGLFIHNTLTTSTACLAGIPGDRLRPLLGGGPEPTAAEAEGTQRFSNAVFTTNGCYTTPYIPRWYSYNLHNTTSVYFSQACSNIDFNVTPLTTRRSTHSTQQPCEFGGLLLLLPFKRVTRRPFPTSPTPISFAPQVNDDT